MSVYGRLLPFVKPHKWRMVGAIAANLGAAVMDAFSLALLAIFLVMLAASWRQFRMIASDLSGLAPRAHRHRCE